MRRDDQERVAVHRLAETHPVIPPGVSLAWTAAVDVAPRESLGRGPIGERWIVPILGGCFWSDVYPALHGRILAGGADRQLRRPDGVKQLRAEYEMQTDDGAVLTVLNEVLIDEAVQPQRYAISRIQVLAPEGAHAWLNRRLFIGTLDSLRPDRQAVLVRAWLVGSGPG